jgi:hypothetical protein
MKKIIFIFTVFITQIQFAQTPDFGYLDWEKDPKCSPMLDWQKNEQEVTLKYFYQSEFIYVEKYNNNLLEYFTIHKIVKVIGDNAIESNNKVYIGKNSTLELAEAKVRVITPDNKIIELDKSNIKESEGNDEIGAHYYFAIDGIEKGSDIEIFYTVLRMPVYDGKRVTIQNESVKKNVTFSLITPENLEFKFKSYNNFPEVKLDSSRTGKNFYLAKVDSMGKMMDDEKYSAYDRNVAGVGYKLQKNTTNGKNNIISFNNISQDIYKAYHYELDKANQKALKKFIADAKIADLTNPDDIILALENYAKQNISIIKGVPTKTIAFTLKDKYTSPKGMTVLLMRAYESLDIKTELVLTCDRYEDEFSEEFEHYGLLENMILYFPTSNKYLAPTEYGYRYGLIPSEWTNQKGLFIKSIGAGDLVTGVGKVKFIEPTKSSISQDNMNVNVVFEDINEPTFTFKRELSGHSSIFMQTVYSIIDDKIKKEFEESYIKFADKTGEITEYKVTGTEIADINKNPLVFSGTMSSKSSVEKAGNKYIFKVGDLIGPQTEMYKDSARITDIEHSHNMIYNRTITIKIPEGYKVDGLEKLAINEVYPTENSTMKFISTYKVEGDVITINVLEQYDQMSYSKTEINDFIRIINAAANFNKVVLFLSKSE